MKKKLRVALIGCGGMGTIGHIPIWASQEDAELVALCDIIVDKAERAAEKFNVPDVYEKYEDIIARDDIDVIDICTPNYLHSIIAVAALESGKHVLCEKPDAVSVAEAEKMKAASEKSGKTLMVIRNNRFMNSSQYAKKYIEEGKMGGIYAGHCGWRRRRGIPGRGGWFTTKAQSGGGPLIDLGVHMIDLAIWLMGNPVPVSVTGCTYNKFASSEEISDSINSSFGEKKKNGVFDVEDLAMGFIRFDNGACLTIEFSWASNVKEEKWFVELYGEKSGLKWQREPESLEFYTEQGGALVDLLPRIPQGGGHGPNIRNFIDVVRGSAQPCYEPWQGVNMIKILEALYKSAETGREVRLDG